MKNDGGLKLTRVYQKPKETDSKNSAITSFGDVICKLIDNGIYPNSDVWEEYFGLLDLEKRFMNLTTKMLEEQLYVTDINVGNTFNKSR